MDNISSNDYKYAVRYLKSMGISFINTLGNRHNLTFCSKDPDSPLADIKKNPEINNRLFEKPWEKAINTLRKKNKTLLDILRDKKKLFSHIVLDFPTEISKTSDFISSGCWNIPCNNDYCKYSIDIPLPPSPSQINKQIEISSTHFFSTFINSEINTQWHAAILVQNFIHVALCNVPYFCALFSIDENNAQNLLNTSIGWYPEDLVFQKSYKKLYCENVKNLIKKMGRIAKNTFDSKNISSENICFDDIKSYLFGSNPYPGIYPEKDNNFGSKSCYHEEGLFYHLPLNSVYFIGSMGMNTFPAKIIAIPFNLDNKYKTQISVTFLVPNLTSLYTFIKTMLEKKLNEEQKNKLEKYWKRNDCWEFIFKKFISKFFIPKQLIKMLVNVNCCNNKHLRQCINTTLNDKNSIQIEFCRSFKTNFFKMNDFKHLYNIIDNLLINLEEKLEKKANQLWVLHASKENQNIKFNFIISKKKRESLIQYFNIDNIKYIDILEQEYHPADGILGQMSASLITCSGISVFGDFRTMGHTKKKNDQLIEAELFLYAKRSRDYYAFPIFVSGRLWGMLAILARNFKENNINSSIKQFDNVLEGNVIASILGDHIEKNIYNNALSYMEKKLDLYIQGIEELNIIEIIEKFPYFTSINKADSEQKEFNALYLEVNKQTYVLKLPSCPHFHKWQSAKNLCKFIKKSVERSIKAKKHIQQKVTIDKANEKLKTQSGWAHSIGNNLWFIRQFSNKTKQLCSELDDKLKNISNWNDLYLSSSIVDHFISQTYRSNQALVRMEASEFIFSKKKTGRYHLKDACISSLLTAMYVALVRYKKGDRKYSLPINILLDDNFDKNDLKTKDKLIDNYLIELQKLYKKGQTNSEYILDLLIQYKYLNFRWFDTFSIEIDEEFKTNTEDAWHIACACFTEIWTNAFKYVNKGKNGKRSVKLKISCKNNKNLFYVENTSIIQNNLNKKGHSGIISIENIVPALLGYSMENRNQCKKIICGQIEKMGLFKIHFEGDFI